MAFIKKSFEEIRQDLIRHVREQYPSSDLSDHDIAAFLRETEGVVDAQIDLPKFLERKDAPWNF
jgi:hypothetical protein